MFTRPDDLSDAQVVMGVEAGWNVTIDELRHAPVGFGSHHWWATVGDGRRFVTVDDLDAKRVDDADTRDAAFRRLAGALGAAAELHAAGLGWVVAPRRAVDGAVVRLITDRYALAVYPFVEGASFDYGPYASDVQRRATLDRLVELHQAVAPPGLNVDRFPVPKREALHVALRDTVEWGPGPFAEPARRLLERHRAAVEAALVTYDELVTTDDGAELVVTHGEPHPGNTIAGDSGVYLIDWDTCRLAPRERDLWSLVDEDATVLWRYEQATGFSPDPERLHRFRLWWDLCEVSLYVDDLRRPHRDDEDTRIAWQSLRTHLDPTRWKSVR